MYDIDWFGIVFGNFFNATFAGVKAFWMGFWDAAKDHPWIIPVVIVLLAGEPIAKALKHR